MILVLKGYFFPNFSEERLSSVSRDHWSKKKRDSLASKEFWQSAIQTIMVTTYIL